MPFWRGIWTLWPNKKSEVKIMKIMKIYQHPELFRLVPDPVDILTSSSGVLADDVADDMFDPIIR